MGTDQDDPLEWVHHGWNHLRLQRPLAAWAAWQRALRLDPENRAARQALDRLAVAEDLPAAARVSYRFRPPRGAVHRARWDSVIKGPDLADLDFAAQTFHDLAAADPSDTSALFNEALCLAWLGRNVEAVATLDRFVQAEAAADPEAAGSAWVLAEVLRHGAGAEPLADDLSYSGRIPWSAEDGDPTALVPRELLRILPTATDPGSNAPAVSAFEWLDRPMPAPAADLTIRDLPRVLASVVVSEGTLQFSTPSRALIDQFTSPDSHGLAVLCRNRGPQDWEKRTSVLPLNLLDAAVWTFRLPADLDDQTRSRLLREAVEDYFENRWIHQPRIGLGLNPGAATEAVHTPLTASLQAAQGDRVLQAKLAALVRFREQLARRLRVAPLYAGYPFDRLRRRLGLEVLDPDSIEPDDPTCMSLAELQRLDPAVMDRSALSDARQSAEQLDDRPLAARFAAALAGRDPSAQERG